MVGLLLYVLFVGLEIWILSWNPNVLNLNWSTLRQKVLDVVHSARPPSLRACLTLTGALLLITSAVLQCVGFNDTRNWQFGSTGLWVGFVSLRSLHVLWRTQPLARLRCIDANTAEANPSASLTGPVFWVPPLEHVAI